MHQLAGAQGPPNWTLGLADVGPGEPPPLDFRTFLGASQPSHRGTRSSEHNLETVNHDARGIRTLGRFAVEAAQKGWCQGDGVVSQLLYVLLQ